MTTLAEMTPAQRAECVGMWATNLAYTGDGESVGVIACVRRDRVRLIHTHINGEGSVFSVDTVSPRFDLPRAWNPDGTPIKGHWNYGEHLGYTVAKAENAETADLRRFVGEWEEIQNR